MRTPLIHTWGIFASMSHICHVTNRRLAENMKMAACWEKPDGYKVWSCRAVWSVAPIHLIKITLQVFYRVPKKRESRRKLWISAIKRGACESWPRWVGIQWSVLLKYLYFRYKKLDWAFLIASRPSVRPIKLFI